MFHSNQLTTTNNNKPTTTNQQVMTSYNTLLDNDQEQRPLSHTNTDSEVDDYDNSRLLSRISTIRPSVAISSLVLWTLGGVASLASLALIVLAVSLGGVPMFSWSSGSYQGWLVDSWLMVG